MNKNIFLEFKIQLKLNQLEEDNVGSLKQEPHNSLLTVSRRAKGLKEFSCCGWAKNEFSMPGPRLGLPVPVNMLFVMTRGLCSLLKISDFYISWLTVTFLRVVNVGDGEASFVFAVTEQRRTIWGVKFSTIEMCLTFLRTVSNSS